MNNKNKIRVSVRRVLLLTAAAGWLTSAGAEVTFNPEIAVSGIYTDNLTLAPAGAEENESIAQVRPGLLLSLRSQRIEADLDYQMENYFFAGDSQRNQTFHELDADWRSEAIEDYLFFDATARVSQALINPEELVPYSNYIETENRADYTAAELNPFFLHSFGN